MSTGRLIKFWANADELPGLVSTSLSKTIRTYPAVGWVRANLVPDTIVYKELNELRKENDKLLLLLKEQDSLTHSNNLAGLADTVSIGVKYAISAGQNAYGAVQGEKFDAVVDTTWGEIFSMIAPPLLKHLQEGAVFNILAIALIRKHITSENLVLHDIDSEYIELVRIQLRALDLINLSPTDIPTRSGSRRVLIWSLTPLGEKIMLAERSIKKVDFQES